MQAGALLYSGLVAFGLWMTMRPSSKEKVVEVVSNVKDVDVLKEHMECIQKQMEEVTQQLQETAKQQLESSRQLELIGNHLESLKFSLEEVNRLRAKYSKKKVLPASST